MKKDTSSEEINKLCKELFNIHEKINFRHELLKDNKIKPTEVLKVNNMSDFMNLVTTLTLRKLEPIQVNKIYCAPVKIINFKSQRK